MNFLENIAANKIINCIYTKLNFEIVNLEN